MEMQDDPAKFRTAIEYLVSTGVFSSEPFCLIDVGCSGGIALKWRLFKQNLHAHGI